MPVFESRTEIRTIYIAIMVDTQGILSDHSVDASEVIYMCDTNGTGDQPSSGEGTDELSTTCSPGYELVWRVFAMNGRDTVTFTDFYQDGNLFGNQPPSGPATFYQATVVSEGQESYQVGIMINGTLAYTWDPYINSVASK